MSNSKISIHFTSINKNNNSTPKKTKSPNINNSKNSQEKIEKSILSNNNEEEIRSKSCYKTPYISKKEDISYSKMEMPVSYQLTNGRCVRLRNSQMTKNYYDFNINENEQNNISYNMYSKSSNTSQDNSFIINKKESEKSFSKSNNSLLNYGKSNYIYPLKFVKHHQKKLLKEESQKVIASNDNFDNEIKTYKKFNLMINPSYKYNQKFSSSPIHKYLPYCKKNDEQYKKNLISYIRDKTPNLDGAKSVSCAFAKYAKNNNNENPKQDDKLFFFLKKKKKIYSTKKVFAAEKNLYNYCLIDGKNKVDYEHPKKFRFFFDNDIGFNYSWQSPLIVANGDDDVETDDEVLNMAEEKCMDDLIEGINTWNKSSRLCRNYTLVKKLNRLVNTPSFNSIIKNKKNRNNVKGNENKKENSIKDLNNSIDFIASFGK